MSSCVHVANSTLPGQVVFCTEVHGVQIGSQPHHSSRHDETFNIAAHCRVFDKRTIEPSNELQGHEKQTRTDGESIEVIGGKYTWSSVPQDWRSALSQHCRPSPSIVVAVVHVWILSDRCPNTLC